TGKGRDARRHADERSWRPRLRLALRSRNDATPAIRRVRDAGEILINIAGEKLAQRLILAAQDDDLRPLARRLLSHRALVFVVSAVEDDNPVLDRFVRLLDGTGPERDVVRR